jgi:hypothetical protein
MKNLVFVFMMIPSAIRLPASKPKRIEVSKSRGLACQNNLPVCAGGIGGGL